jgi:DsbE subfamily thiol:disulfide oxidoreductase
VDDVRLRILLVLLGLLSVSATCHGSDNGLGLARVDRPLPTLAGPTVQGSEVTPADYAGHVLVVNFWATWCGPCRQEQPALQQVWARYGDRGVDFVGVNYRDDAAAARAWIDEFGVTYPSIADAAGGWADDFALRGAPTTFIADATGRIRYLITGAVSADELSSVLDGLLMSASP